MSCDKVCELGAGEVSPDDLAICTVKLCSHNARIIQNRLVCPG